MVGFHILIGLLSWQFFKYVDYVLNIITPNSFDFDFEPVAVINFVILTTFIVLSLALFLRKRWALVTAGSVGLVFLIIMGFNYINLIGVAITVPLFLYARNDSVEEINQRTKVNPRMIVRRGATAIVMSLFILISFAAFQSPVAKGIAEAQQLPSASKEFMRSVVDSFIGSQIPATGQEKENIINEVTRQTFQQINGLLKPYFQYAPSLLAFGLFLVLWGLSWIFIQLSVLAGVLIFWILKKKNFLKVDIKDVKAEVVII